MLRLNNNGFSLIEMLITLALIGLILPLILSFFVSGVEDYVSTNHYIEQQYKVQEAVRLIRQDIEKARVYSVQTDDSFTPAKVVSVTFIVTDKGVYPEVKRKWSFASDSQSGYLYLEESSYDASNALIPGSTVNLKMVDGIDISRSGFEYKESLNKFILFIRPKRDEKMERNLQNTIITEFSVRYKQKV